ncbi:MAG: hypothetical protein Q8W51_12960 [Candidatus Palauibacterales bacterium]|nr:hypothetical protein [Candidatus Palauibacterales bacterium]MDP2530631.1 hypothetical protein [Candidatus Palauibacterales bacterium]MDP2583570.1 hypothetical protein [Candidatus Palauibacterales bacterium]
MRGDPDRGGSPAEAPLVAVTAAWSDGPAEHPCRRVWLEHGYLEGVRAAGAVELHRPAVRAPVLAVQWHPERRLPDPEGGSQRLFEWFGEAVRAAAGAAASG